MPLTFANWNRFCMQRLGRLAGSGGEHSYGTGVAGYLRRAQPTGAADPMAQGRAGVPPCRNSMAAAACSALLLLSLGCSKGTDATSGPPIATGASGSAGTTIASSKSCKLFTRREIAEALAAPVGEGADWGPASMGCEWSAGEDLAVQAIVVPDPEYWENLAKSQGGEPLSGLGEEAFVAPWLGAFRAGALTPQGSVYVMSPKHDLSVALLRKAVERAPGL